MLGLLPTQDHIVLERFFDEVGDMHLVVHSPYGSRLNRAWGLALRKRFCRTFNFELQAAALDDCITDPGELHDALLLAGFLTWDEPGAGAEFFTYLAAWIRLSLPVFPCRSRPPRIGRVPCANSSAVAWSAWERSGPRTSPHPLALPLSDLEQTLAALKHEGFSSVAASIRTCSASNDANVICCCRSIAIR